MFDPFFDTIAKVTRSVGFPIMIFDIDSDQMVNLENGTVSGVDTPENIRPFLQDENVFLNYFSKGNQLIVIYFLRVKVGGKRYVFVINDSKKRARLNRFFFCLLAAVEKLNGEHGKLGQEVQQLRRQVAEAEEKLLTASVGAGVAAPPPVPPYPQYPQYPQYPPQQPYGGMPYGMQLPSADQEMVMMLERQLAEYRQKLATMERMLEDAEHKSAMLGRPDFDASVLKSSIDERLEQKNKQLQVKDEIIAQKDLQLERKEIMLKEVRKDLAVKDALLAQRNEEMGQTDDAIMQRERKYAEAMAVVAEKDHELHELSRKLSDQMTLLTELDAQVKGFNVVRDELHSMNEVLKGSRNKLMRLMDGLSAPLFSVNNDYTIISANKKASELARVESVKDLIGKPCYQAIYGLAEPCEWCRIQHVSDVKGESAREVEFTFAGITTFEHTMFPVNEEEGSVTEFGESILDLTEKSEMNASLDKFRDQIRKFKKARIEEISELGELQKAYKELSENYDLVLDRNQKMTRVIERLVSEDQGKELMKARTDLNDARNKLQRALEAIKNYQRNLEDQDIRYNDLNKRTFFQMERLMNVLKNKVTVRNEEAMMILDFLNKDFDQVKKTFLKEAAKKQAKEEANAEEQAKKREEEMEAEAKAREASLRRQSMAQDEVNKKKDKTRKW